MNPALNRESSEARLADLRRQAGRDAIALADIRAARRESASTMAPVIRAGRRSLQRRRIRRWLPRARTVDTAGAKTRASRSSSIWTAIRP
jgi:hypothetical protein